MGSSPRFAVYASSLGNCFFEEIRDLLACGLLDLGLDVRTADETGGFLEDADGHVVVAPHEFFLLGAGARLRTGRLPERLVFYGAEQPGSTYFFLARRFFPLAREVWHVDGRAAEALRGRGFSCRHIPLGYAPRYRLYQRVPDLPRTRRTAFLGPEVLRRPKGWEFAGRPLDVFFAGSLTDRRGRFFARHAPALSRHKAFIHLADSSSVVRSGAYGALDGLVAVGLEQRAKIVLNIHRGRAPFFEWHRIGLHGLGQRALVVTEPVGTAMPFKAGRDYVEAAMDDIPGRIRRLLSSSRGRREAAEIAGQGFETFSTRCRMADLLRPAVEALAAWDRRLPGFRRLASLSRGETEREACRPRVLGGAKAPAQRIRRGAAPKVTVAVSVRDCRRHLRECLDSVAGQTLRPLDIVVVDDCSTDGSGRAALRWLVRNSSRFRRWDLVRLGAGAGAAEARNEAFERSRSPYVFVLDGDSALLPPCLERLAAALDRCGADFAYSYLRLHGEEGLSNLIPWDPALLKTRDYIDGMAMVRRSSWRRAGGYDARLAGWQDYDFWLTIAGRGGWGVLVPEFLSCRRVCPGSMTPGGTGPGQDLVRRRLVRKHRLTLESPAEDDSGDGTDRYKNVALSILRYLDLGAPA